MELLPKLLGLFCTHANTRCVHGDEINLYHGRRVYCVNCDKPLNWALPVVCSYTLSIHPSYKET